MKPLVLVTLFAALSGCASQSTPPSSALPIPSMSTIALTGCTGGDAHIDVPEQLVDTPVPPGWQGSNELPIVVRMFVVECAHISLGQFERGPIQLVVESHDNFSAPENCRQASYTFLNVLTRIVWSDPEIAAAVEAELGIPTSVGTIDVSEVGTESLGSTTYSWTIDGAKSSFTAYRADNEHDAYDTLYRYVWPAGDRLGLIDFSWAHRETWLEPSIVHGSFAPPMILGTAGPMIVGQGLVEEELFPSGTFQFFEGYECVTQISP